MAQFNLQHSLLEFSERLRGLREQLIAVERVSQEPPYDTAHVVAPSLRRALGEIALLKVTLEAAIDELEDTVRGYAAAEAGAEPNSASRFSGDPGRRAVFRIPGDLRRQGADEVQVTIYMSDAAGHELVEAAVEALAARAGLSVVRRDEPVLGSYFRRMWAAITGSELAREAGMSAVHAAEVKLVTAQDAAVTATLMQNVPPVIAALGQTKDAVVRVGALLIVKRDWTVLVYQLNAQQQLKLDHSARLPMSPHEIAQALSIEPVATHTAHDPT